MRVGPVCGLRNYIYRWDESYHYGVDRVAAYLTFPFDIASSRGDGKNTTGTTYTRGWPSVGYWYP
jgi:hypothetical protein